VFTVTGLGLQRKKLVIHSVLRFVTVPNTRMFVYIIKIVCIQQPQIYKNKISQIHTALKKYTLLELIYHQ